MRLRWALFLDGGIVELDFHKFVLGEGVWILWQQMAEQKLFAVEGVNVATAQTPSSCLKTSSWSVELNDVDCFGLAFLCTVQYSVGEFQLVSTSFN